MPASDSSGLVTQARRYSNARPPDELRFGFLALIHQLGQIDEGMAANLAHEYAAASPFNTWQAMLNTLIREHSIRAAVGDIVLPLLGAKTMACRTLLLASCTLS